MTSPIVPQPYADAAWNLKTGYDDHIWSVSTACPVDPPMKYMGLNAYTMWISTNGYVSFLNQETYYNGAMPQNSYDVIVAPFLDDASTQYGGYVSYQYYSQPYGTDGYESVWSIIWKTHRPEVTAPTENDYNKFQLLLKVRAGSDWDITFNYETIKWNSYAGVGFAAATKNGYYYGPYDYLDFNTSGQQPGPPAYLDTSGDALTKGSYNSNVQGRYIFKFQDGVFGNMGLTSSSGGRSFMPISLDHQ